MLFSSFFVTTIPDIFIWLFSTSFQHIVHKEHKGKISWFRFAKSPRFWKCIKCDVNGWKDDSEREKNEEKEKEESKKGGDTATKEDEQVSLLQNQVNTLNDKLTSMESNLNALIKLLKNQAEEK